MKVPAIAILLLLASSTCMAGERNSIVKDLMSMKPCVGYLTATPWGKSIDDVEAMLLKLGQPDCIMRNGGMIMAAYGRKSKDQPVESAKNVISASFENGILAVVYVENFATEEEAKTAVKVWDGEARNAFTRERGRESEHWTATCPDGTKLIAHGFALEAAAMYSVLFVKQ